MIFSLPSAASFRCCKARSTSACDRDDRQEATSSIISISTRGSTFKKLPSPPSGDCAVSWNALTPTTVNSPASIWRTRSVLLATSRFFNSPMAANAPPNSITSANSASASRINSAVRPSITCEPSKMSSCSSKSVSKASTCCIRRDHC